MSERTCELETETPEGRFLSSARECRTRDLRQLVILCALVGDINELIHALQKERGTSSIFLGSQGEQFRERLATRVADSRRLEQVVRGRLEHVDDELDRMSSGARFYIRVALVFRALEALGGLREQIGALAAAPQDAVKGFTDVVAALLAVIFEVADIAADPIVSRALVALVNFSQGKEYAGQERATAGAAFSRGQFHTDEHRRMQYLIAAQEQAFRFFCEFAEPAELQGFNELMSSRDSAEVARMRAVALAGGVSGALAGVTADTWYERTTRRIDAMKAIEEQIAGDLNRRCTRELAQDGSGAAQEATLEALRVTDTSPVAVLVADVDPALNTLGGETGIGLYTLRGVQPKPMRSILAVVQAQSRRIEEVSHQLESARTALTERKIIERAKGLLMQSRRMSEKEAYAQIRQTAMNQNRRIIEVAEAIVSMAEILQG